MLKTQQVKHTFSTKGNALTHSNNAQTFKTIHYTNILNNKIRKIQILILTDCV